MKLYHSKAPALVRSILKADAGIISTYIQHIEFLKKTEHKLLPFLGPPLNKHCTIANYANDTLVLHTDAPTWASRIRYNTPGILNYLQNECGLTTLRTIRIKAMPAPLEQTATPDKSWKLDKHTASLIKQSAATITDKSLKDSLEKICEHVHSGP